MSTGFTSKTVALILERQRGRCFWCRAWIASGTRGVDWSAHHRCPRQMGGNRAAWVNAASNGVALCGTGVTGCHGWVESNRSTAIDLGLLVSGVSAATRPDRRPIHIPVTDSDGAQWWLTDDGRAVPVGPEFLETAS